MIQTSIKPLILKIESLGFGFGLSLFTFDDLACSIIKMVNNIEGWFILDVMGK